jgi:hypothetical protein
VSADVPGRALPLVVLALSLPVALGNAFGLEVSPTHAGAASAVCCLAVLALRLGRGGAPRGKRGSHRQWWW